jgi:CRP/FNR family transcriptional regulator, cyclic AMP receptor protein
VQLDPRSLADLPLFESLSDEDLESVARWAEVRHAEPGDRLCGEGAAGYSFFVLRDGAAAVTRDGEDVATLRAGDFFGELAILGDGRRTATVTATEPTELLVMFGTDFRRLEQELPESAMRIKAVVADRLAADSR